MTPEMLAALRKPFPPEALEQKDMGGGKKFTYIAHHAVNNRLIEVTQGNFDFLIINEAMIPWGDGKTLHKVHGRLTLRWPEANLTKDVDGKITLFNSVTVDGTGVQIIYDMKGEDLWKGAESDALKKAASKLGVGLDLYGTDVEREIALNTFQMEDDYEPASIDQRTYIQSLWKRSGYVARDKKGKEHHDAAALEKALLTKFNRTLVQLSKEQAAHVITGLGGDIPKKETP